MKKASYRFDAASLLLLLLLLFPAFSSARPRHALEEVGIQLQWKHQFEFAGFYAASEKGYYHDAGLKVEIREYAKDADILESVLSGKAEFGTLYSSVIRARMRGKPVMLLANYFKRSPLVFAVKPNILFPNEMKGKKIMGEKHELASSNFDQMFQQFNMTTDDFTIVPQTFTTDRFINGEVDGMTVFLTNEVHLLSKKKISFNIIDPNNYGVPLYDVNLFTAKAYADKKPAVVRAFRDASNKGWSYALDHPGEIIDLILEKYNSQNKSKEHLLFEARETRRIMLPEIYPVGSIDPNRLMKIEELFVSEGVADAIVEPESFIFGMEPRGKDLFTPAEKAFIQAHPTLKVIRSFHHPPFTVHQENRHTGYLVDLLSEVVRLAELQVEYVDGFPNRDAMAAAIQDGSVDLLPNMNSARELPDRVVRTVPVVTTPHAAVGKINAPGIMRTEDMFGKKVAVVKGCARDEHLEKLPRIRKVHVENNKEGFEAVRDGKAEYFLGNLANAGYVLRKTFATDLRIAGALPYTDFPPLTLSFAVNGDRPELVDILNKALAAIPLETLSRLRDKWLVKGLAPSTALNIDLTPEEQVFLSAHPTLRAAFDADWPPVEFSDEDGGMAGISSDYLKRIGQKLGVRIQPAAPGAWKESAGAGKSGEPDFISAISPTDQRREWMDFTNSHLSFPIVVVTREAAPYIGNLDDLAGESVAVIEGRAPYDLLSANHPELSLAPTRGVKEGLMAVADGKAFAYIGSLAAVSHVIGREGLTGLKVAGNTPYNHQISMGVRKGEVVLLNLLQKALAAIPGHERNTIYAKWIGVTFQSKVDYALVWKIIAAALVIVFFILYWNRRLSFMARELKKSEENYRSIFETANDAILIHDIKTGAILNVNKKMLEMFDFTEKEEVIGSFAAALSHGENHVTEKEVAENLAKAVRGEPQLFEWRAKAGSGRTFRTEVNLKRVVIGGEDRVLAIVRDITERKKAEDALRESQAKLLQAQYIARIGDFTWDVSAGGSVGSDGLYELLKYNKRETIDHEKIVADILHPDDLEQMNQWILDNIESGKEFLSPKEHRLICKDGEVLWVQTNGRIEHQDGKATRIFGTCQDITHLKRVESALRTSEQRYRTLIDMASDAIFLYDENDNILDTNRRVHEMLGYTREELSTMTASDLQAPEVRGPEGSVIKSELERGGTPFETMDIRRDGVRIPVEVCTSRVEGGGDWYALSVVRDITERKRTEEELPREKAFSDAAIASLPGIFYVLDEQDRFLRWNRNFETVSGLSGDEISRVRPEELFPPEERAHINKTIREVFDKGWSSMEAGFMSKEGSTTAYLFTGARFEARDAFCLAGMGVDITARKQAERERLKLKKLESVGLLAGGIAHDFNNLLTGLFGNIEMAKMVLPEDHKALELLELAGCSLESATHLTNQLLTFAKGGDPIKETLSIGAVITETARFSLRGSNVKLQSDIAPDLFPVEADKGQLSQVIGNLVINAKQAMPTGGVVTIAAENIETPEGGCVQVTVRESVTQYQCSTN